MTLHVVPDLVEGINRLEVLQRAATLITGDRATEYGDAAHMHSKIGVGWASILDLDVDIEPEQVALMMAWVKICRASMNLTHDDSWVDGAGYLALGAEMASRTPTT